MLVSTGTVRTWLGVAANDTSPNAKIESLIYSVQDFVDSYTGRKLEAAVYRTNVEYSYLDGTGSYFLYVPQYPVSHVNQVNVDSDREWGSGTEIGTDDIYFYPSGKIISEGGYFLKGHRNILIDYNAGFAPVVGGTHNAVVGSYPCPYDLSQTIVELVVKSFQEGITAIHTVQTEQISTFQQLLSANSFWKSTLERYKKLAVNLEGYID